MVYYNDVLANFAFTTSETKWVASRVAEQLNIGKISLLNRIIAKSSAFLPQKMSILAKNSWINRNWSFPVVHYFTWKIQFVSNILSTVVATPRKKIGKSLKPEAKQAVLDFFENDECFWQIPAKKGYVSILFKTHQ